MPPGPAFVGEPGLQLNCKPASLKQRDHLGFSELLVLAAIPIDPDQCGNVQKSKVVSRSRQSMSGNTVYVIIMVVCLMAAYIAPAFVAHIRHHRNASAIMALNVLLGWTILGWVIALVWALTDNVEPD
jgi:ABC-type transport system involved in cytochrome c biogenesis permease component